MEGASSSFMLDLLQVLSICLTQFVSFLITSVKTYITRYNINGTSFTYHAHSFIMEGVHPLCV